MKLFLIAFAVIAAVAADVSHLPTNEYLPPVQEEVQVSAAPSNEYLAPVETQSFAADQGSLAADGYRYKTQRRVVYRRNRRDVSHLPSNEYLPPQEEVQTVVEPSNEYLAPVETQSFAADQGSLAADGYRYKTHRRVVYRRNRRDVSHLPSNEYLPPQQAAVQVPTNEYLPPQQVAAPAPIQVAAPIETVVAEAAPAHELADDGYRYKTHRRVVYRRNRRDVSHLPSNEYLPPQQAAVQVPTNEYLPPQQVAAPAPIQVAAPIETVVAEAAPAHELADDGYRYKTHRRVVYRRNRRDVSHLPSNEYLPPQEEVQTVVEPSNEYLAPVETQSFAADQGSLAADGYRYKTHRRVVYRRNRRDVSHLPSNEYLPPQQAAVQVPTNEYLPPQQVAAPAPIQVAAPIETVVAEAAPAHELADDGYRYKTHRRVVYRRNRRDVSHLPSNEYLPPQVAAPTSEYLPPVSNAVEEIAVDGQGSLADDGYRYKTQRRRVIRRNRRDVSHVISNEYLPPQQNAAPAPVAEYLPPVQAAAPAPVPVLDVSVPVEEAVPAHELADDGYRYKTHRRVVYRRH
ncbi:hypothetical protein ACLKA7_016936 [Drosophila subpalustris]